MSHCISNWSTIGRWLGVGLFTGLFTLICWGGWAWPSWAIDLAHQTPIVVEAQLGNVLTYEVTGLTPATTYNFYVTALDAEGNESSASNTVQG